VRTPGGESFLPLYAWRYQSNIQQANIGQTICVSGWTATVCLGVSYTNQVKHKLMQENGWFSQARTSNSAKPDVMRIKVCMPDVSARTIQVRAVLKNLGQLPRCGRRNAVLAG
jgi:hypothetical protein